MAKIWIDDLPTINETELNDIIDGLQDIRTSPISLFFMDQECEYITTSYFN